MCPHAQIREELSSFKKIRCVLVDDHVLLRQGLRRLLEDEPDLQVVAEAESATEALQKIFEHRPEIVILDASTFDCTADQAEALILRESPHSRVLLLSPHDAEAHAKGASRAVRQTSAEELVEMVRRTHARSRTPVQEIPRRTRGEWDAEDSVPRRRVLTTREREVLKLLAEGRTVRSAADVLGLSAKTVDSHKFNLMRKLGLHNKAELVMWAIQKRVVKLPAHYQ